MKEKVHAALNQARENGYDLRLMGYSPEQIALDLKDYDVTFETTLLTILIPHIKSWLEEK